MERFAAISAQALSKALTELSGSEFKVQASELETPPDPRLGDLGFPCFRLAKQFRKGPPQLAAELSAQVAPHLAALTADIEVKPVGPYVNCVVKPSAIAAALLHDIGTFPFSHAIEYAYPYGKRSDAPRSTWDYLWVQ